MERTKLLTIAVIGLLLLNTLTIGFMILKRPPRLAGRDGTPSRVIIERLHLDASQRQQYRQLIEAHQQQTHALSDESAQLFREYYGLLTSEPTDTSRANALSAQIAENQRALAQLNFAHFQQLKQLCRPDQQAKFDQLVNDLSRLFGQQQRPRDPGNRPPNEPPAGRFDGPPQFDGPPGDRPENSPPRP